MQQIRFDDFEALEGAISEEFGPWGPEVEITQDMIQRFADLTGDHQWIHVDVEKARQGPFGGPIAHGFLTASVMPKLEPPWGHELVGFGTIVNYGCESFRFLAPVPAGSKLHARGRLVGVRQHKTGTLLTRELSIHVVGNEKPSLVYRGMLIYGPAAD